MNDIFKKLNVLVRSSINEVLGDDHALGGARRRPLTPEKLGKNIDREIGALRERINDALAYEDELVKRAQAQADESARLDQQADEAVAAGNDALARRAIEQMQFAQQRLAMTEADLREHRLVTQELIERVNMLEAAVADAKRAQAAEQQATPPPAAEAPGEQAAPRGLPLADVLRDAREKIAQMGDLIAAKDEVQASAPGEQAAATADEQQVDDDLSRRRERLSKPKS